MKAVVKIAYFDENGLHKKGDIVETATLTKYLDKYAETPSDKAERTIETAKKTEEKKPKVEKTATKAKK